MNIDPHKEYPMRECPGCALDVPENNNRCPVCGYDFPQPGTKQRFMQRWALVIVVLLLLGLLRWFV